MKFTEGCCVVPFLVAFVFVTALPHAVLAQNSALIGTWKLNLTKSKYQTPAETPKSLVLKIEAAGMATTSTLDGVGPDGATSHWAYTAGYDGKDVPITGNNPFGWETASRKVINATTSEVTYKKSGQVASTNTSVLSADGKTFTVTTKGTNPQGRAVNNVLVYEKQ